MTKLNKNSIRVMTSAFQFDKSIEDDSVILISLKFSKKKTDNLLDFIYSACLIEKKDFIDLESFMDKSSNFFDKTTKIIFINKFSDIVNIEYVTGSKCYCEVLDMPIQNLFLKDGPIDSIYNKTDDNYFFLFHGYSLFLIRLIFKIFNIHLSGGSTSKRHITSILQADNSAFLTINFGIQYHSIIKNSFFNLDFTKLILNSLIDINKVDKITTLNDHIYLYKFLSNEIINIENSSSDLYYDFSNKHYFNKLVNIINKQLKPKINKLIETSDLVKSDIKKKDTDLTDNSHKS
jgi:hypothetical protein